MKRFSAAFFALIAAYPLFRFVYTKRYRPPRKIRIRERVPPGDFLMEPEFVLFESEKGPVVISRTCTHLGCMLAYDEIKREFICPCHQSRFSWNGRYISGPAKKDLPSYPVQVTRDGKGYVVLI